MKKALILISALFITGILPAQENYELLLRAKSLIDNGKATEASNMLSAAIAKSQDDSRLYLMRAEAYVATGNYSGATSDYQAANKLVPSSGEFGLAKVSALNHDVKKSLSHLEQNLSSQFKKGENEVFLDKAFSVIENTPEWRLFWKTERYGFKEKQLKEIEYCVSTGNRTDALQAFQELAEQYPADNQTLYARALVDYSMQKYSASIASLASLAAKDKNNTDYLLLLGTVQAASGNPAGASTTYGRLIDMEYLDAELLLKRAGCYRKTQEYDKAEKDLRQYLSLYPGSREALSLAGKVESEKGDNLKAIEYFSRNLDLHPGDPQCYIDRANSFFVSRTWNFAINDYGMALDLKPDNAEVWFDKGISLLSEGRTEDACHDFKKAHELGNKKASSYISRNCLK